MDSIDNYGKSPSCALNHLNNIISLISHEESCLVLDDNVETKSLEGVDRLAKDLIENISVDSTGLGESNKPVVVITLIFTRHAYVV